MKIAIGADHRGFELKNKIVTGLKKAGHTVIDVGAHEYDAADDFPQFGQGVAKEVQHNPNDTFGIVICGSGIGVCIAANRYKNVRCGLIFDKTQVEHAKKNDHINTIALPSDYITYGQAMEFIDIFLNTQEDPQEKYIRRKNQLDTD